MSNPFNNAVISLLFLDIDLLSHNPSKAQHNSQNSVDLYLYSSLLNSITLQDQARIRGISHHSCVSAWLRTMSSESLGLTLSAQEFMVVFRFWLSILCFLVP